MPAKSWAIIYSPKEGSTSTHKRWKKIRRYMEQKGLLFDFVQSEGPGSVERLASMMTRSGYRTILVVGGDAALNHALCGIMNTPCPDGKHPALGVIPNGFGNDFAKYWGMTPDNYKQTIDGLIYHHTRKIDVGRLRLYSHNQLENTTFFLNCANLGVAASITNLRRRTSKLFGLKTLSYFASAISLIFKQMNFKYHFKLSGEDVKQSAMTLGARLRTNTKCRPLQRTTGLDPRFQTFAHATLPRTLAPVHRTFPHHARRESLAHFSHPFPRLAPHPSQRGRKNDSRNAAITGH